jgi:hypothetical protein
MNMDLKKEFDRLIAAIQGMGGAGAPGPNTAPPTRGNLVGTSSGTPPAGTPRTGNVYQYILAAAPPAQAGQTQIPTTVPLNVTGDTFYFVSTTAVISVKEQNGNSTPYYTGTGRRLAEGDSFNLLQLQNFNPFPVAVQIFIGFGGYIDNRLLPLNGNSQVGIPGTENNIAAAASLTIPDNIPLLSVVDAIAYAALPWVLLQRTAIQISNFSATQFVEINQSITNLPAGVTLPSFFVNTDRIPPATTRTYPQANGIQITNPGGAGLTVGVVEFWLHY